MGEMIKIFKFKIITRYVLREFLLTFAITFLFFFVIFFINNILLIIKPLLEKQVPLDLVSVLMVTFFPLIFIYSLPFGIMLATLMTMGRFSSDNEIVAFRALGFSYVQIFRPIIICGAIIMFITFIINDRLLPYSLFEQRVLMKKVYQLKPTMNFKSKTVKKYENPGNQSDVKIIFTDIVEDNKIKGMFIIDRDRNNQKRIITARQAEILTVPGRKGVIELLMKDTMIQLENKDRPNEFNFGYSDSMAYYIDMQEFEDEDSGNLSGIEKTAFQNYEDVVKYRKLDDQNKDNKTNNLTNIRMDIMFQMLKNENFSYEKSNINDIIKNMSAIDANIGKLAKLRKEYDDEKNSPLNESLIQLYYKFANPLACIIFVIFAAPIGIYSRRAGFQIGFILGLFLTAFYWFSLSATMVMGRMFIMVPFIAMFLPNLVFLIVGLYFFQKRLKE